MSRVLKVVGHQSLRAFLVFHFDFELLEKKDPSNETWFGVLLVHGISNRGVVGVDDHLVADDVGSKLVEGEHHCEKLLLRDREVHLGFIKGPTR